VWPFITPETQITLADFLKFDSDGTVSRWETEEPVTVEQARKNFGEHAMGKWEITGRYTLEGSKVSFTLAGLALDDRLSSVPCTGMIYESYIALNIDWGHIFPPESRYHYREYDFVPLPNEPM
jgi:hypothetical protein